jgi:hypothetical protein
MQTMEFTGHPQTNPLLGFMRQPKIFIRLPSGGRYWPQNSLQISDTGEYPVYSMTARDEMLLKVPDALMNGQAVVDVIQNCMPNIKDAWATPNIDIDAILIAIRIATYGEKMTTPVTLGENLEFDYSIDLRSVLDSIYSSVTWDSAVPINENITVFVRPINYRQVTKSAIQTFETQKIIQLANNESIGEEDKVRIFKESFNKLTEVTVDIVSDSIYQVDTNIGSTTNPAFIKEFIDNADKEIFNKIQDHLEQLKEKNALKSLTVPVTDDLRAQGITDDKIEIPLVFDASTFFE